MSVLSPVATTSALGRVNPVAKIAATIPITLALVLTLDWVSATVALVLEIALLTAGGLGRVIFSVRCLPVFLAAPLTGFSMVLYGQASGESYFQFWLINVTEGSVAIGLATCMRVLAIALPAVVLFVTIDPTELADGLAQRAKLPSRFVLGALAALRLVGLFIDDWRSLQLARRARGVADRGLLRRLLGQAFALLVLSIRRGSKLATAMEARGFGGNTQRSWARASDFGGAEWLAIAAGFAVAAVSVAVAVATGSWNFVLR